MSWPRQVPSSTAGAHSSGRLPGWSRNRWAEERRRGLTIDLGFAWTVLLSGREVAELLGLDYEHFTLAGMFPVAYTKGTDFKLAQRASVTEVLQLERHDVERLLPRGRVEVMLLGRRGPGGRDVSREGPMRPGQLRVGHERSSDRPAAAPIRERSPHAERSDRHRCRPCGRSGGPEWSGRGPSTPCASSTTPAPPSSGHRPSHRRRAAHPRATCELSVPQRPSPRGLARRGLTRRLLLRHDSIVASKVRSLYRTQGDSNAALSPTMVRTFQAVLNPRPGIEVRSPARGWTSSRSSSSAASVSWLRRSRPHRGCAGPHRGCAGRRGLGPRRADQALRRGPPGVRAGVRVLGGPGAGRRSYPGRDPAHRRPRQVVHLDAQRAGHRDG